MKVTAFLFFGILLCATMVAQADPRMWGEEGIPIRQGMHPKWEETMARDANGNTLLVWSDMRDGQRDLRAQLVNSVGDPQWAADGVNITPEVHVQDAPVATSVDGGWVIAWVDYRDTPECIGLAVGCGDIYAQKLDYLGNRLWPNNDWTGVGVDVAERWLDKFTLEIVHDGAGGAIIAWVDLRHGNGRIFAQRITANGSIAWSPVLEATGSMYSNYSFDADAAGDGGMVIVWSDDMGMSRGWDVFASRILPDGTLPWGGVSGAPVCTTAANQNDAQVVFDGASGCYVLWTHQATDNYEDLYAQRLQGNGLPAWQVNGIPVCTAPNRQSSADIALSYLDGEADGLVAVWLDHRASYEYRDVYGQKISPEGVAQWTANGILIAEHEESVTTFSPRIVSDLNGGLVCTWGRRAFDQGQFQTTLLAQRLNESGTLIWAEAGVLVASPSQEQSGYMIRAGFGTYIIPFFDWGQTGTLSVRYQMLDHADGSQLFEPEGREVVAGFGGNVQDPQAFSMSDHHAAIIWEDGRGLWNGPAIYYQIVGPFGEVERTMNGEMLAPNNTGHAQYNQQHARACEDGNGGLFVTFMDLRGDVQLVRLSHIDHSGEVTSSDSGEIVWWEDGLYDQWRSELVTDGEGGCYVAWSGYTSAFWLDLWVIRLDAQLLRMWDAPVRLSESSEDDLISGVVASSGGSCIVSWVFGTPDVGFDIKAARVNPNGEVAWSMDVCNATGDQDNPMAISDGSGGAYIVWSDRRGAEQMRDIYAQRISTDGIALWTTNGIAVDTSNYSQNHPRITLDSRGDLVVVWEDFRNGDDVHVYAQKLSPSGNLRWPPSGVPVARPGDVWGLALSPSENRSGFFAAWSDNRDYYSRVFATHLDSTGAVYNDPYWRPDSGGVVCDLVDVTQYYPSAASDGWGGCVAAWVNMRNDHDYYDEGPIYMDLYAQRLFDYASSSEKPGTVLPREYALYQNYPNPFNPVTMIAFDLPQASDVELKVFDLLGREVAALIDRSLEAGAHHIDFDATSLPSGIYFYRLQAGTFAQTRKLVLLK